MEENNIRKAPLPEETLEQVSAGYVVGRYNMTVGNCNGGYLPLCTMPAWNSANEIERLWPNCMVSTNGATASGIGRDGKPCIYIWVCFNGTKGWAERDCLGRC